MIRFLLPLALCIVSCSSRPTLILDLRTDLVPVLEFTGARVEVETDDRFGVGRTRTVDLPASDFVDGARLTTFAGLRRGRLRVRTTLLDGRGRAIQQRLLLVQLDGDVGVTVLMTRDCTDVECDSVGGEACINARCMNAECSPETPEFCEPECGVDTDCAESSHACAEPRCVDRFCFYRAFHDRCDEGELCSPDDGCVPGPVVVPDGGGRSDGSVDGSVDAGADAGIDGGPCCDDGNPCTEDICEVDGSCRYVAASAGERCDDGLSCTSGDMCNTAGLCRGTLEGDFCVAGGTCVAGGSLHPIDQCRTCTPAAGAVWVPIAEGTSCASIGACDAVGICRVALPEATQRTEEVQPQTYQMITETVALGFDHNSGCGPGGTVVMRLQGDGTWAESELLPGPTNQYFGVELAGTEGLWAFATGSRSCSAGARPRRTSEVHPYVDFGGVTRALVPFSVPEETTTSFALSFADDDLFVRDSTATVEGVTRAGEMLLYRRDFAGELEATGTVRAPAPVENASFGSVVVSHETRMLVTASGEPGPDDRAGVVYVFEKDAAGDWEAAGTVPTPASTSSFGRTLALRGDVAVVSGGSRTTLFSYERRPDGEWVLFDTRDFGIGEPVAFSGSIQLLGGVLLASASNGVHVYRRDPIEGWAGVAILVPSGSDRIGTLSVAGDTLSIGGDGARFFDLTQLDLTP